MSAFQNLPNEILHVVLSEVIRLTVSQGWQFSLRLVNHRFNDAFLYVFYLQERLFPLERSHSLTCKGYCPDLVCTLSQDRRSKDSYISRFGLQSLLTLRELPGESLSEKQLMQYWRAAVQTLEAEGNFEQLDKNEIGFYTTCSGNPIFNHIPSAILAEAIRAYNGTYNLTMLAGNNSGNRFRFRCHPYSTEFWVALCACVIGDLKLCQIYIDRLAPLNNRSLSLSSDQCLLTAHQHSIILMAAMEHSRFNFIHFLFEIRPSIMSEKSVSREVLKRAICTGNNDVLEVLLRYTPCSSDRMLEDVLQHCGPLISINQLDTGSKTIRLLASHFVPLSAEARYWLISQSCAVGDLKLVEGLVGPGSVFDHGFENTEQDHGFAMPSCVRFAIHYRQIDSLRFLLDHEAIKCRRGGVKTWFYPFCSDQIECVRVYHTSPILCGPYSFAFLGRVEGGEEMMANGLSKNGNGIFDQRSCYYSLADVEDDLLNEVWPERRDIMLPLALYGGAILEPSSAQYALEAAIQFLRSRTVHFLLNLGVRPFPPTELHNYCFRASILPGVEDPFEIRWPQYNTNQDGYWRTQAVLGAFGLPKIRVVV